MTDFLDAPTEERHPTVDPTRQQSSAVDLTYVVEPLAKLIYHAGACGEVNGKNSMELALAMSQGRDPDLSAQPTEKQSGEYFSAWFPTENQDVYRRLAEKALAAAQDQMDEAVAYAADKVGTRIAVDALVGLEDELVDGWGEDRPPWYRPIARLRWRAATEAHHTVFGKVFDARKELERPAPDDSYLRDVEAARAEAREAFGSAE